ncbi:MAG: sugar kinase [Candidatus Cloacimonetes bacterium]|nr:sugar kinase [Candidatus Cloacimonadota bacterium]
MSLVIVGSVALDSVKTPFGEVDEALGGSAMYASMAAKNFCRTRIVGVVGEDFPQQHLDLLASHGIDAQGLARVPGRTFRWTGAYSDLNVAETLDTQLNVFASFKPELPDSYRKVPIVFLGNIDPSLQMRVLGQATGAQTIALDTMNFWISGAREKLLEVIRKVHILFINEDELRQLTGERNLFAAAARVREMGARWIVVKQGEYGAMAVGPDFLFFAPPYPLGKVVDPTGAGDSFAGGCLGAIAEAGGLSPSGLRRGMLYGTVMASFNIENFSLDRLATVDRTAIDARYAELLSILRLDSGSL